MRSSLAIGDFARATHMSIKTLRHYHRVGLLEPADVDPSSGYRYYAADQIPTAQVIRRFRALDMPLDEIQAVLAAPDPAARNDLIAAHLDRLEQGLARTQRAVASLRDLLAAPSRAAPVAVEHRGVGAAPAAAIREVLDAKDSLAWYQGALGELYGTVAAQDVPIAGPAGGVFSNDLFSYERGEATIFVPTGAEVRPMGRVVPVVVPAVELATTVHEGPHTDIDRAYGALGAYVTRHELAVEGPIREYYVVGQRETADQSRWRTEIGWPIFRTGAVT
ncbi:MAG TPA: MerR family transcriptional regulator [Pseudonocardia sp.]|jgi:DNA-binding transcriptional MerR regulator|nr:MerR family transcriptional regulator [Pseudonocardia sp.]